MVDILAAVTADPAIGNRPIGDLDMSQIAGVQADLDAWNPACGQFNYTLDSDSMTFEETVVLIATAAFCAAYRQNGRIRLALDRPQAESVQQFTHRNKKPKSETITRTFANDSDYDGVELVYTDPTSEQPESIVLPLDGSAIKVKKIEGAGIRDFNQAWYRACRELARIRYQRLTIETTCTTDARMLLPNSRIDVVDNTRFKSYDGEIRGRAGFVLRLSQKVVFTRGEPHSIRLTRRDGSTESIAVEPGTDSQHVVLQALPSEAIVTTNGADGVATIYSFASDSARGAMAWLVTELDPPTDNYVTLRAINYDERYWAGDSLPIPDRESVIN